MEVFEKSQTVDPEVRAYVYSLVSAIGGSSAIDDGRYVLGDDALACLKDIRRWLKLYDTKLDRFDVKRVLAEANLVKGDLLEILGQWNDEDDANVLRRKIALGSLELLTELTWPLVLDGEKATVNHVRHAPVLRLAQLEYKRAILHHESESILHKAIAVAVPAMTIPRRERNPREEGIINLALYLFRNIVMISQPPNFHGDIDEGDISRSETIVVLEKQDIFQLVLTICSSMGEDFDEQDVIVLELLFHLLKGIDPQQVFREERRLAEDKLAALQRSVKAEKSMLSAQARTAPSRHNRFGTMIWVRQSDEKLSTMTGQDTITSNESTLEKMDASKQWNRPQHAKRDASDPTDFMPQHLDSRARKALRSFVSDFLDSSFNPLFTHLRRAIEREVERVKEDHRRQYFFLISWFLRASACRQEHGPSSPSTSTTGDTPFAYVASVLTQETFVLLQRTLQRELDEKSHADVHACLLAFTQIMLTVSRMADSPNEDDQDIAENMQSRLFYEEATHDRILAVLRGYQEGRQGFAYLDAATDLAHTFVRLLERYSKVNPDIFVRSKRRARKKASMKEKGSATVEGLENDEGAVAHDDPANDVVEAHREVQERKFDFSRFAARFVNEASINTFLALLGRWRELNDEQLKRCHRFFYRVAFKMERIILLYRVDILVLFQRLIKGPQGLDSKLDVQSTLYKEWSELTRQIFRRCIKKLGERPELYVEMLFTKIPGTLFYLEHGYEKEIIKAASRAPAELQIKPGMDHIQEIGVAVGALINQGKLDALAWIKGVMGKAIEERRSWEDLNSALAEPSDEPHPQSPSTTETKSAENDLGVQGQEEKTTDAQDSTKPQAPSIVIIADSDERKVASFKDKHLRLLLKTLAFQRLGSNDDPDASWIVPSSLRASTLEDDLDAIRKFEFDPPVYENGQAAESFIRNESAARRNAYEKDASDDDGDSDLDENLFVPGGPTVRPDDPRPEKPKKKRLRRKGEALTEEEQSERAKARKNRDKEKDAKIKSTLFVTDSDDEEDEERDAEFFRLEKQRRGETAKGVKSLLMEGRSGHGETVSKNKMKAEDNSRPQKKRKIGVFDEDSDVESPMNNSDPIELSSRESTPASDEDDDDDDMPDVEDHSSDATPPSSQSELQDAFASAREDGSTSKAGILSAVSRNEQRGTPLDAEEEDEDEVVVVKSSARRNHRPVLVIEDDSD